VCHDQYNQRMTKETKATELTNANAAPKRAVPKRVPTNRDGTGVDMATKVVALSAVEEPSDTRSRILRAAHLLFRKRGYHGTGLADILELAQAPKGSMYHHFPGGKEQIGVAVIEAMSRGLLQLLHAADPNTQKSANAIVKDAGAQLIKAAEKTNFEMCALFAAFVAERNRSQALGAAVQAGYDAMIAMLAQYLQRDGFSPKRAASQAALIVALLEGGSLLAQAKADVSFLELAIRQARQLTKKS
jgi:TetR/AcrR family transcriptional regulator, lmrAB and yxaGH operons repressor